MRLKISVLNKNFFKSIIFISTAIFISCNSKKQSTEITFKTQVEKLKVITDLELLQYKESVIAVSPSLQGRILLSSFNGLQGKPNGWLRWKFIEDNSYATKLARLGGESRLWFAPEFGKYSIFFDKGDEQVDANMRAPIDLNEKKFIKTKSTPYSITSQGKLNIKNADNYVFKIDVKRTIGIITEHQIEKQLNIDLKDVSYVGYYAESSIFNKNEEQWTKEEGLLSIWELSCMKTTKDNVLMIPLAKPSDSIVNYLGNFKDKLRIKNQIVYYNANATFVNKIGVPLKLTRNVMGSYSKEDGTLKICTFHFTNGEMYVNSKPKNTTPYQGDVINIFNGEVTPSLNRNWPFYEFESSSEAKELQPNESLYHKQNIYHFKADFKKLNAIAQKVLGVDLKTIPKF